MNIRALFILTILTSAFLLFLIQPMLSKIILPRLGGTPAVWQTAMMFYQALLLGGYVYAHAATRRLGTKKQSRLHIALLVLSLASLPVSLHATDLFTPTAEPVRFLLLSLLLTIGAPFFILSANAPLIQHWYACHTATREYDPYMLYSASNLGSFAALLAYPFAIEPLLTLSGQTLTWSVLYGLFAMLLIACVWQINRHFEGESPLEGESKEALEDAQTPTWRQKLHWVLLAFVPSSLMLGVTTHMTTDIASVPLLWVLPLALYLLTFVLAFHPKMPGYYFFLREQVMIVAMLVVAMASQLDMMTPFQLVHFLAFFTFAMVCHGQLALSRPKARFLTGFYVWVSIGGALGGIFNALIAPQLFTSTMEYWLVIALACFLRPQTLEFTRERWQRLLDILFPAAIAAMLFGQRQINRWLADQFVEEVEQLRTAFHDVLKGLPPPDSSLAMVCFIMIACALLPRFCQNRPVRLGYTVLILFFAVPFAQTRHGDSVLHRERNFFGISVISSRENPPIHVFAHGTTLHGLQSTEEEKRLDLTSYYIHMRDIYRSLPDEVRLKPAAVGGLGAGTMACLGQEGQEFDFFEIDAAVKSIAENPAFFTYLRDCPTKNTVTIADARLGLEAAPDGKYGAIFMDAYSSDSLPMHLMTREALAIYLKKLTPNGIIAFHISNRYLQLGPILGNLAEDAGLVAINRFFQPKEANAVPAQWVVMARHQNDLEATGYKEAGWTELSGNGQTPWSDDYSNLLEAIR